MSLHYNAWSGTTERKTNWYNRRALPIALIFAPVVLFSPAFGLAFAAVDQRHAPAVGDGSRLGGLGPLEFGARRVVNTGTLHAHNRLR